MADKLSMVQLLAGPKDGHSFSWVGSLPKHLYFSVEPTDNDPDIVSQNDRACLVYEHVDRHVDISSGRVFEFYKFVKYRKLKA